MLLWILGRLLITIFVWVACELATHTLKEMAGSAYCLQGLALIKRSKTYQ